MTEDYKKEYEIIANMDEKNFHTAIYDINIERFLRNDNGVLKSPFMEVEESIEYEPNNNKLKWCFRFPLRKEDEAYIISKMITRCKDETTRLKGIIPKGSLYYIDNRGFYVSKTALLTHVWDKETESFIDIGNYNF